MQSNRDVQHWRDLRLMCIGDSSDVEDIRADENHYPIIDEVFI